MRVFAFAQAKYVKATFSGNCVCMILWDADFLQVQKVFSLLLEGNPSIFVVHHVTHIVCVNIVDPSELGKSHLYCGVQTLFNFVLLHVHIMVSIKTAHTGACI